MKQENDNYKQRYKEAIERAKIYSREHTLDVNPQAAMEYVFPELKESEDEQHRKWIIEYLYDGLRKSDEQFKDQFKSAIAWLEKKQFNTDIEQVFRPLAGCDIDIAAKQAVEQQKQGKNVVLAFNGCYIPVKDDTADAIVKKYNTWLKKQGKKFKYWNPSKEQLEALDYAYNLCPDTERGNYYEGILETLIADLHKLSEKQDEQKSINKDEPKFKDSDWIVTPDNEVKQIEEVTFGNYWFTDKTLYNIIDTDNKGHLWTIQDAQNGDVLSYSDNTIVLFKILHKGEDEGLFTVHCLYLGDKIEGMTTCAVTDIHPATEEQRDQLFSKMREAGYEWNPEKKELSKIEDEPIAIIPKFRVGDIIRHKKEGFTCKIIAIDTEYRLSECCGTHMPFEFQDAYELVERKPSWSEENEQRIEGIIATLMGCVTRLSNYGNLVAEDVITSLKDDIDWLKSLKERIKHLEQKGE